MIARPGSDPSQVTDPTLVWMHGDAVHLHVGAVRDVRVADLKENRPQQPDSDSA